MSEEDEREQSEEDEREQREEEEREQSEEEEREQREEEEREQREEDVKGKPGIHFLRVHNFLLISDKRKTSNPHFVHILRAGSDMDKYRERSVNASQSAAHTQQHQ